MRTLIGAINTLYKKEEHSNYPVSFEKKILNGKILKRKEGLISLACQVKLTIPNFNSHYQITITYLQDKERMRVKRGLFKSCNIIYQTQGVKKTAYIQDLHYLHDRIL